MPVRALLSASAAAVCPQPGSLPTAVLAVAVRPELPTKEARTLLRDCVRLTLAPHPGLRAAARNATWSGPTAAWAASAEGRREADAAAELLHPAVFTGIGAPARIRGMRATQTASAGKIRLRLSYRAPAALAALRDSDLFTPTQAADLIDAARGAGLVVVNTGNARRLDELADLLDTACVLLPADGLPGWAQAWRGPNCPVTSGFPAPVDEALASTRTKTPAPIAVSDQVAQIAAINFSAPAGRAGLRAWQDEFVSAYLASRTGLVNALPPGLGKTVCASYAMGEAAETARVSGRRYRAVVIAATGLHSQWLAEIGKFFPAANVEQVTDTPALTTALRARGESPHVVLTTPTLLNPDTLDLPGIAAFDDLIVDEAAFLRSTASGRTRALVQLRTKAVRAMPLTGTPAGHGPDDIAALVEFTTGTSLFARHPLSKPHPLAGDATPQQRVGPLLFTRDAAHALPRVAHGAVRLRPDGVEQAANLELVARLTTAVESPRPALSCASALRAARATLALAAGPGAATGRGRTKVTWARQELLTATAAGQQAIVFCDALPPLTELGAELKACGVGFATLTTATKPEVRAELAASFAAGRVRVVLASAVAQLGLNLQGASLVIHLDVPAGADTLTQRTARTARIGSAQQVVRSVMPILAGTCEQVLAAALDVPGRLPARDLAAACLDGKLPRKTNAS